MESNTLTSKNLKDILLNLDEPTYTPFLQNIKFSKDTLNVSQREAIRKALYSGESAGVVWLKRQISFSSFSP